jgi:hypothetical protein
MIEEHVNIVQYRLLDTEAWEERVLGTGRLTGDTCGGLDTGIGTDVVAVAAHSTRSTASTLDTRLRSMLLC